VRTPSPRLQHAKPPPRARRAAQLTPPDAGGPTDTHARGAPHAEMEQLRTSRPSCGRRVDRRHSEAHTPTLPRRRTDDGARGTRSSPRNRSFGAMAVRPQPVSSVVPHATRRETHARAHAPSTCGAGVPATSETRHRSEAPRRPVVTRVGGGLVKRQATSQVACHPTFTVLGCSTAPREEVGFTCPRSEDTRCVSLHGGEAVRAKRLSSTRRPSR